MTRRPARWVSSLFLLTLAAPFAFAAGGAGDASGYRWLDSREPGVEFQDDLRVSPIEIALPPTGVSEFLPLPFLFRAQGKSWNEIQVRRDGELQLFQRLSPGEMPRELSLDPVRIPGPRIAPLGTGLRTTTRSLISLRATTDWISVRWARMSPASGNGDASMSAFLYPDGSVSFQYLALAGFHTGFPTDTFIGIRDSRGVPLRALLADGKRAAGFDPAAGYRVVLAPLQAAVDLRGNNGPRAPICSGDDTAPGWCTTVDPFPGSGCATSAGPPNQCGGQPGGFPGVECSDCAQTQSADWHFDENNFCLGCQYVFYVLVGCGEEMHLPMFDAEGMRIRVYDAITGASQTINAQNDCFKRPFLYCNLCANGGVVPEPFLAQNGSPFTQCDQNPLAPNPLSYNCEPINQTGTEVSWGYPAPPPCSNTSTCPNGTGASLTSELTNVDTFLRDPRGLCGVYRVEIESGGNVWDLFANCNGCSTSDADGNGLPDDPNCPNFGASFQIYHNCAEAVAAYQPRPELFIESFAFGPQTDCGNRQIEFAVTIKNQGCSDLSVDIPIRITFDNGDAAIDDLVVNPGQPLLANGANTWTSLFNYSPSGFPVQATVLIDPNNVVTECSEDPTVVACSFPSGTKSLDMPICVCNHIPTTAIVTPNQAHICRDPDTNVIDSFTLDGGTSSSTGCGTGGTFLVYQWENATTGQILQPFDATATTFKVNPTTCDAATDYRLRVACSDESATVACQSTDTMTVFCRTPDPIAISTVPGPSPVSGVPEICVGSTVTLTALVNGVPLTPGPDLTWTSDRTVQDGIDPANEHDNPIVVTPTAAGPYFFSVVGMDQPPPSGCPSSSPPQEVRVFAAAGAARVGCLFKIRRERDPNDMTQYLNALRFNWENLAVPPTTYQIVADPCTTGARASCKGNPPDCPYLDGILRTAIAPDVWGQFADGTATGNLSSMGTEKLIYFKVRSVAECVGQFTVGSTGLAAGCGSQAVSCP